MAEERKTQNSGDLVIPGGKSFDIPKLMFSLVLGLAMGGGGGSIIGGGSAAAETKAKIEALEVRVADGKRTNEETQRRNEAKLDALTDTINLMRRDLDRICAKVKCQ
jgi:hypothetical protein